MGHAEGLAARGLPAEPGEPFAMPANPTTHPSTETLHALALGKLDDRAAEAVLSHLRSCPDCCQKAGNLPDDSFLGRLRDVHAHRETPSPDRTASRVTEDRPASRAAETTATGARFPEAFPAPFGRYRILKLLGKGGMGAVYLAHDTQLDRPVALKVPYLAADEPRVLERFYREARAAATILHPNICPLHDVGEVAGTPYLTMAYIEGKPLSEFAAARPLTPRQSGLLVRKLALALQEAHQKGVIHRDLKPSNVMIDRRGEPIIMDFGLARRTRAGDARLTQHGAVLGTPAYMPPEQVSGDIEATGPASDVYSLGVILYELLTGRLPFTGDAMAMLSQVLLDEPPAPSELRPDLDPALEGICLNAMAKKIEDRYASMAELAAALTDALRTSTPASAQPAAPAPKPAAAPEAKTEAEGFRTNQMGGLRSVANLHAELPARKPGAARPRRRPKRAGRRQVPAWFWLLSTGLGVALMIGLVAAVVIRMKTRDGVLVVEVNEPNADVFIDGNRVTVTWSDGGKKAEVRIRPGTHKVEVKKDGLTAYGEEVTLEAGGKKPIRATFKRFDKPAPNTLTDKEKADGWRLLFDGTSTGGWHKYRGQAVGNRWKVAGGALTLSRNNGRNGGDIVTDETFEDFELSIQWKVTPGANSGILYRVRETEDAPYGTGPEYQILDNARHPDGKLKETSAASCYGLYAPSQDATKPVGEWNQTLIVIKGNHVEHWLNGVKVVEYDFGSDDWKERVAASKFKKWKSFGTIKKGAIVLQDHGDDVAYRNIKIRGWPAQPGRRATDSFFNGKDLTGWEKVGKGDWTVEDGILRTRGADNPGWLATRRDYGDFELELEYRLGPRGNSGVFVHAWKEGHPSGGQFLEIQLIDDQAHNTAGKVNGTAAIFGVVASRPVVQSIPGTWHKLNIRAKGRRLQVSFDTRPVVDANLDDYATSFQRFPGLMRSTGRIGLQHFGTPVDFRKIQIRELAAN
jgi:anti-sigma factor RsiW